MEKDRAEIERFMRVAIDMGELAITVDETPVGCCFVYEGEVIAKGMNDTNRSLNGTRHAEFVGIEKIMAEHKDWSRILHQTDLYVTVEPCIMCAAALRQYGIRSVYYGASNDKFGGTGGVLSIHNEPSLLPPYPAMGGIFREEAIMLLRRFYIQENVKAPEPHGKKDRQLKTEIRPWNGPPTNTANTTLATSDSSLKPKEASLEATSRASESGSSMPGFQALKNLVQNAAERLHEAMG